MAWAPRETNSRSTSVPRRSHGFAVQRERRVRVEISVGVARSRKYPPHVWLMALPHESECRARTRAPPRFGLTPETNGQGDSESKVFGKSTDRSEDRGSSSSPSPLRRRSVHGARPPRAAGTPHRESRRAAVCAASIGGAAPARVGTDDGRGSPREGSTRKTRSWDDPVEGGVAAGAIAAASIDSTVEAAGTARTAVDGAEVRVGLADLVVPVVPVARVVRAGRAVPAVPVDTAADRSLLGTSRTRSSSKACSSRRRTTRASCAP